MKPATETRWLARRRAENLQLIELNYTPPARTQKPSRMQKPLATPAFWEFELISNGKRVAIWSKSHFDAHQRACVVLARLLGRDVSGGQVRCVGNPTVHRSQS